MDPDISPTHSAGKMDVLITLSNVFNCIGQTCGPGLTESPECTGKRQSLKVSFFYMRFTDKLFLLSNMIDRDSY